MRRVKNYPTMVKPISNSIIKAVDFDVDFLYESHADYDDDDDCCCALDYFVCPDRDSDAHPAPIIPTRGLVIVARQRVVNEKTFAPSHLVPIFVFFLRTAEIAITIRDRRRRDAAHD